MAAIDETTFGRGRLSFADERDIDEFVQKLEQYERGELSAEAWRKFRLVRGTYGQRQDNVQMMRIKIPQGIVTGEQMRALADASADIVTAWVDFPSLAVKPDPQRYTCISENLYRFESLDSGFTADITFAPDGLVSHYPGLFRRA